MRFVPLRVGASGASLVLALTSACASMSASDEELARLRRDLHTLRAELATTKSDVQRLEGQVTLLSAGERRGPPTPVAVAPAAPTTSAVPPSAGAGRPSLPVVRLERPATTTAGGRTRDPDGGAVDDGSPPILIRVGPTDAGEKLAVDRDVLDKPDPVLSSKGARATEKREKTDYEVALSTLREKAQPAEARALFQAFQARYPRSGYADNVAYWLAECSAAEGQWARAIEELSKLVSERPSAAKAPDALLLTAEAWLKLGKSKDAEDVLRRLIKSHPNSAARAAADKRLAELGAT